MFTFIMAITLLAYGITKRMLQPQQRATLQNHLMWIGAATGGIIFVLYNQGSTEFIPQLLSVLVGIFALIFSCQNGNCRTTADELVTGVNQ